MKASSCDLRADDFAAEQIGSRNGTHVVEPLQSLEERRVARISDERAQRRPAHPVADPAGAPDADRRHDNSVAHGVRLLFHSEPTAVQSAARGATVIAREAFLSIVQHEKRRADRSCSPLSVAVFHVDRDVDALRNVERLLALLAAITRETDTLGRLDDEVVAVLLPETSAAGLQHFVQKVLRAGGASTPEPRTATYPDTRFDQCLGGRSAGGAAGEPGIDHTAEPQASGGYGLKRGVDIVGSAIALILLSPLMLVVATAIRLSSPGPALFRQTRLGKGGVPFVLYKFRSMRIDADDRVHRDFVAGLINGASGTEAGSAGESPAFKLKADPRITPLGRWLRKTSVDEIPQFFNVLKGEMSLVGPRPPVGYEVDSYQSWHLRRVLEMKPGLTGIWQVEGRSKVSFDDMVRMDLRYLRSCSLGFDLLILLRTVKVVLSCDGAE